MQNKINKEEDKKPEDAKDEKSKQDEGANSVDDRIAAIENKVDQLVDSVTASKQEDEDPKDEKKKKEEEKEPEGEPKPEEEKKKEDEEEKKPEEEKTKEGSGEDVKLPKAPAGETDETGKPEGDKVQVLEKVEDVEKKVEDIMKSKGWVPAGKTPRATHEIAKRKEDKPTNLAMDLLNKAKKGEITVADLNRTVKGFVNKNYTAALRTFIEKGRKKEVV